MMGRYFGWLRQPVPGWFWLYAFAAGMFTGTYLQAVDGAAQRGAILAWQSHVVFLAPLALMVGWLYALGPNLRRWGLLPQGAKS